jgi:hypothetical protein
LIVFYGWDEPYNRPYLTVHAYGPLWETPSIFGDGLTDCEWHVPGTVDYNK